MTIIRRLIVGLIIGILLVGLTFTALPVEADNPTELIGERQENSKTFQLDGKRQLQISMGAIHYKDNYGDKSEPWKDIDLTWEGNRITKAPYELTLDGNKITLRDKKSGEVSTIELMEIGKKGIPAKAWEKSKGLARAPSITTLENVALDTDLEIVVEYSRVRFVRVLKSNKAPIEAKFKVTGNIPFRVRAQDAEDELPVETTLKDGILTEILKPDRAVKYPVRIDPTWQVGASSDDCFRQYGTSNWDIDHSEQRAGAFVDYGQMGGGMRFTNITIPQASTINQAYLTLRAKISLSDSPVNTRVSAEDVDDAPTFADNATAFDTRWAARTTARVDWDNIPAWTADEDYDSPEIKTVIQEIVDRGGWASGQDISIFWEDFEGRTALVNFRSRTSYSWDSSPEFAPKLVVEYTLTPFLVIYINGVEKDALPVPGLSVPNNGENWTFCQDFSMLYLEEQEITINGVQCQYIEWEYGALFVDQSGKGNDATPSFRTASSDADISASLISFQPVSEAQAPDYVLEEGPAFVEEGITGNVTSAFTTTPGAGTFPLAPVIIAIAEATETPAQLPLLIIAAFVILAASLTVSATLKRYGSGSLLVKIGVITAFLGVFIALGNFGIDFWMLFIFLVISVAIAFMSKQLGFA